MDATFKICPLGQFYQLLIIYVAFCDQAIPFIYVIMSRKSEKGYVHLFQTLKEIFPLNGNSVMTDFETAMRNAIRNVYPNLKSGGATAPSKKRVYKQRADKIADASEELEKGKITAAIFLNRMSYPGTKICQGLEDFTCVDDDQPGNCELSDDDDADDTQLYGTTPTLLFCQFGLDISNNKLVSGATVERTRLSETPYFL
ncbi:hypothetical protein ACLKA6_002303 [Drosophila palustris]